MHPIVLRAAWISSSTRNSTGKGGGCLIGFMPRVCSILPQFDTEAETVYQIQDPEDTPDRSEPIRVALSQMKAQLYQKVFGIIFQKTCHASWHGSIFHFGDSIIRRGYPDILIESLDGKEACAYCGTRSALANFPCAKCLCPKDQQHRMDKSFDLRTKDGMKEVCTKARAARTKGDKEQILKDHGLHDVTVSDKTPKVWLKLKFVCTAILLELSMV